jgi:sigma-B regulation protein RsbU (phosphoserine phosphatase)
VELIQRIRGDVADKTYHYTILLTSRSAMSDVVEGLESGADDFVAKPFNKDELRVRMEAGKRIVTLEHSLEVQNERLTASNKEITEANERMRESLLSAAKIQQSYLPSEQSSHGEMQLACKYVPCDELAGDTVNIVPLDDTHVALYAIDVSGHGVPAALLSVHLSRILTRRNAPDTIIRTGDEDSGYEPEAPSRVIAKLNRRFIFDSTNQQYFTMLYGILDVEKRQFRYCSAGHPGPIVVSGDKISIQQPMPPAVGFIPAPVFQEETLELQPGDRLMFYTDGVFEIADSSEEEFGEQRLAEAFKASASESLSDALSEVLFAARAWGGGQPFDDDISLLAAEIH